jgi:hypothetical protein
VKGLSPSAPFRTPILFYFDILRTPILAGGDDMLFEVEDPPIRSSFEQGESSNRLNSIIVGQPLFPVVAHSFFEASGTAPLVDGALTFLGASGSELAAGDSLPVPVIFPGAGGGNSFFAKLWFFPSPGSLPQ